MPQSLVFDKEFMNMYYRLHSLQVIESNVLNYCKHCALINDIWHVILKQRRHINISMCIEQFLNKQVHYSYAAARILLISCGKEER